MAGGTLPDPLTLLQALGTGLAIGNLHYLNYSDRPAGRDDRHDTLRDVLGGGRQASSRPIDVLRFDDTVYRLLGTNLEALTEETELLLDSGTYQSRTLGSLRLPGALVVAGVAAVVAGVAAVVGGLVGAALGNVTADLAAVAADLVLAAGGFSALLGDLAVRFADLGVERDHDAAVELGHAGELATGHDLVVAGQEHGVAAGVALVIDDGAVILAKLAVVLAKLASILAHFGAGLGAGEHRQEGRRQQGDRESEIFHNL